MNLGIITSFIVGGLLMVALITVNMRVGENAANTTMDLAAKDRVSVVAEIIESDLRRIGFGVPSPAITAMTANSITFRSTFNTDSTLTVGWAWNLSAVVDASANPDDRRLQRTVNGTTTDMGAGVTAFSLEFLDASFAVTAVPADVRHIRVSLTCESAEGYDGRFGTAHWSGLITPRALR